MAGVGVHQHGSRSARETDTAWGNASGRVELRHADVEHMACGEWRALGMCPRVARTWRERGANTGRPERGASRAHHAVRMDAHVVRGTMRTRKMRHGAHANEDANEHADADTGADADADADGDLGR